MDTVALNETDSDFKSDFKAVLDRVADDADYTVVTRQNAEDVVIMSRQYFDSLMETLYLLKSPANAAHLTESIAQYRAGLVTERDLIEE